LARQSRSIGRSVLACRPVGPEGNLNVYINDPSSLFTSDDLARIQDAINTWDALLVPYDVAITEVSDPTQADHLIDTSTSSACGGMSNGVLGCCNAPNAEITMIQGWNWYAGADPSQIGAGHYDFETIGTRELGHALGLGYSSDPGLPMYESLAAGATAGSVTVQDLDFPDPPGTIHRALRGGRPRLRQPPLFPPAQSPVSRRWTSHLPASARAVMGHPRGPSRRSNSVPDLGYSVG
jgi:hypothetical protein